MTPQRYEKLMSRQARLTKAEVKEGWHYCPEWDGLLIHPSDPEADFCTALQAEASDGRGQ